MDELTDDQRKQMIFEALVQHLHLDPLDPKTRELAEKDFMYLYPREEFDGCTH